MINIRQYEAKAILFVFLALVSFSLVYTSTLNPFAHRIMNIDTSIYVTIAQGITRGNVLYRDLLDNKGPLTYFMSVPGYYIGGLTGVWLTEFIILYISFLFMYKTALLFVREKTAFLSLIATSLAMHPYFYVNAGTEEYALPFLMISLYIFTRHYLSEKNTNFFSILVLGICFACSVMIRLNMFPLWAGFCIIIVIELSVKKKFLDLLKYITAFTIGTCIVLIPIFVYLWYYNVIDAFYYNVILGGVTRGFRLSLQEFIKNFYLVINRSFFFIPVCIGIIWFFIRYKSINPFYFFGYLFSYLLSVIFLSTTHGNTHYNLVLIPFFVPALAFLADSLLHLFSKVKYKHLAVLLFFCITFSEGITRMSFYLFKNFDGGSNLKIAGRIIDAHTKPGDKIINLGWYGDIYHYTKRDYDSKYIFQGESYDHLPGAREEFVSYIRNNPPAVMTIFTAHNDGDGQFKPGWHEEAYALLETDYTLISDEYGIKIFIKDTP